MLFIKPPLSVYKEPSLKDYFYADGVGCNTYSEYNYLRPGLASWIRLSHFEVCLRLTSKYFGNCNVIDFGCADGIFLPSLSNCFKNIVGIDIRQDFTKISSKLVGSQDLRNVSVMCNEGLSIDELKNLLPNESYKIIFLLEVLEHVGKCELPWESRVNFLKELSKLIDPDGFLVISVPIMVGPAFLLQRLGLALIGAYREPISFNNLIKAGFLYDTSELEQKWDGEHLGFNHIRLERHIYRQFRVVKKINTLFQAVYVLKKI